MAAILLLLQLCRQYENMRVLETLAVRAGSTGNCTKRSIIGGDLNLPYVD
jgi:hypothetical protein